MSALEHPTLVFNPWLDIPLPVRQLHISAWYSSEIPLPLRTFRNLEWWLWLYPVVNQVGHDLVTRSAITVPTDWQAAPLNRIHPHYRRTSVPWDKPEIWAIQNSSSGVFLLNIPRTNAVQIQAHPTYRTSRRSVRFIYAKASGDEIDSSPWIIQSESLRINAGHILLKGTNHGKGSSWPRISILRTHYRELRWKSKWVVRQVTVKSSTGNWIGVKSKNFHIVRHNQDTSRVLPGSPLTPIAPKANRWFCTSETNIMSRSYALRIQTRAYHPVTNRTSTEPHSHQTKTSYSCVSKLLIVTEVRINTQKLVTPWF